MKLIEIYGQPGCEWCVKAAEFCRQNNYRFVYRDISFQSDRLEMFARNPDARTVPQVFVGDHCIGGCRELMALPHLQIQQLIGE